MMKEPVTFDAYLDEKLKNPEFKKEWDALEPEFQIIRAIIEGREARHMTQADLAAATGINQANISRTAGLFVRLGLFGQGRRRAFT